MISLFVYEMVWKGSVIQVEAVGRRMWSMCYHHRLYNESRGNAGIMMWKKVDGRNAAMARYVLAVP
jgi:hypothetical protein